MPPIHLETCFGIPPTLSRPPVGLRGTATESLEYLRSFLNSRSSVADPLCMPENKTPTTIPMMVDAASAVNSRADYLFVSVSPLHPFFLASLQVFQAMVVGANDSTAGNQNALILNFTASLGSICALLCALSAYGVGAHRVGVITQVTRTYSAERMVLTWHQRHPH